MEGAARECPASRQNGGGTAEPSGGSNPWAFHFSINSIEFVDYQTQGCSPQATQQPEERVSSAGVLRSGGGRPSKLAASPRRLRASCRAGTALAANPSRREPACPKASRPNAFHSKSFPFQGFPMPNMTPRKAMRVTLHLQARSRSRHPRGQVHRCGASEAPPSDGRPATLSGRRRPS